MMMMTDYKATPEQEDAIARAWAFQQQWAQRGDEDSACFLELRSRIERLELGAGIHDAVIKTLKSPSLKEQALDELHISFDRGYLKKEAADTIRRALEQLDD
jgi:hypothetical protein